MTTGRELRRFVGHTREVTGVALCTPQKRGQAGREPPFVYLDQVVDEVPGAIIPVDRV
jgi:hypothetical protein